MQLVDEHYVDQTISSLLFTFQDPASFLFFMSCLCKTQVNTIPLTQFWPRTWDTWSCWLMLQLVLESSFTPMLAPWAWDNLTLVVCCPGTVIFGSYSWIGSSLCHLQLGIFCCLQNLPFFNLAHLVLRYLLPIVTCLNVGLWRGLLPHRGQPPALLNVACGY